MEKHYGWNNRQTRLVSLWFAEDFGAMRAGGIPLKAEAIREHVENHLESMLGGFAFSGFAADMIQLHVVDWQELATHLAE